MERIVRRNKESSTQQPKPTAFCLVEVETGVGFAFCKTSCLAHWLHWVGGKVEGVELGYAKDSSCKHCYLCGRRCGSAPDCRLHSGKCPDRDYRYTYGMSVTAPIVHESLGRELDDVDIEDCIAAYCDREKGATPWEIAMDAVDRIRERE